MKAWMSSNFGQIPPPLPELSALACLKKMMYNVVNTLALAFLLDLLHFAGNKDNLKVWTEFEFEADRTKGCGVNCP